MSATTKRLGVPLRWSVQDGRGANGKLVARSYRTELDSTFTRAGQKWVADRNGLLVPAAHSVPPFAVVGGVECLLLEGAATNLCPRSAELDNAAWADVGAPVVTANAATAPDGTTTADQIADTDATTVRGRRQTIAIAADTTQYCASVYVKKRTSAHSTGYVLLNLRLVTTGTTVDAYAVVDAYAGTISKNGSADAAYIESVGNYWRVAIAATNIGDTQLLFSIYPGGVDTYTASTGVAGQGTEIFWGAQVETGGVPTSYIPTTSGSVARVADVLTFPFLLPVQAMTIYHRCIDRGTAGVVNARWWQIGKSDNTTPRLLGYHGGTAQFTGIHETAAGSVNRAAANTIAFGDVIETVLQLGSDGSLIPICVRNGGAEVTNTVSSALALVQWSTPTLLSLGATGAGGAPGWAAHLQLVVALGTKTMDEMRALAESA